MDACAQLIAQNNIKSVFFLFCFVPFSITKYDNRFVLEPSAAMPCNQLNARFLLLIFCPNRFRKSAIAFIGNRFHSTDDFVSKKRRSGWPGITDGAWIVKNVEDQEARVCPIMVVDLLEQLYAFRDKTKMYTHRVSL